MINLSRFLSPLSVIDLTSKAFKGRWYPQPEWHRLSSTNVEQSYVAVKKEEAISASTANEIERIPTAEELELPRENAFPTFAPRRGVGASYKLIPGRNGELVANYALFVDSIRKSELDWHPYNSMTKAEKTIYIAHLKAVENRKLEYVDPEDKTVHKTVCALLYAGECCGEGCRHCPYKLENCDEETRKHLIYNGAYYLYELSKHRSRPPHTGIQRMTRLLVVDNSAIGKEANTSGRPAYCIHVYKHGYKKKHMPHATLGDKILVAIKGEMKKAIVVGEKTHVHYRKHGVPATDTNNIVLIDAEENPVGTRILSPIPAVLLKKRSDLVYSKVLSLANKFF